jgi:hypothetical protein
MFKNLIKSSALAVAALAVMTSAAFASDGTTATVTGGSLTITNPAAADFAGRSITGADQTTTAALATFSVSDFTGSGAGWTVTAQADQFVGVNHELATGSLLMSVPTVTANGTDSTPPTINPTVPFLIDNASAALVATAGADEGMGKYDFSATTLTLALPAAVYADAYDSSVTISVVAAP